MLVERGKRLACPPSNQPFAKAFLGQLHMSITECCAQTRTDPLLRQQAAGAYQLPRKLATDPLSPAAVMVHDIISDIGYPTGSSPCHKLYLRECTRSKDLFLRLQLRETSLNSSSLIWGWISSLSLVKKALHFCCKTNPKMGHSLENFKSHYILSIIATHRGILTVKASLYFRTFSKSNK